MRVIGTYFLLSALQLVALLASSLALLPAFGLAKKLPTASNVRFGTCLAAIGSRTLSCSCNSPLA
jgi:hypothetical protein